MNSLRCSFLFAFSLRRSVLGLLLPLGLWAQSPAPVIESQPESCNISLGTSKTFSVVLASSNTAIFTQQWMHDGAVIPGATNRTYTISKAVLTDAGSYFVRFRNTVDDKTSDSTPFTVSVQPAGTSAKHSETATGGRGYASGGTLTIDNIFTFPKGTTVVGWSTIIPSGWSYVSDTTSGAVKPEVGMTGTLEWVWSTLPASPYSFSYTLKVPTGASGAVTISGVAYVRVDGVVYPIVVTKDITSVDSSGKTVVTSAGTITISPMGTCHDADTNMDWRIDQDELLGFISLYGAINGTVRTGCYRYSIDTKKFTAANATVPAAITNSKYHMGDTNKDSQISLGELMRLIELYSYSGKGARTGEYHIEAGTEDGFAVGP